MLVDIDTTYKFEYNIPIQIISCCPRINICRINVLADIWFTRPKYPSAILFRKKGVGLPSRLLLFFLASILAHEKTKYNTIFRSQYYFSIQNCPASAIIPHRQGFIFFILTAYSMLPYPQYHPLLNRASVGISAPLQWFSSLPDRQRFRRNVH